MNVPPRDPRAPAQFVHGLHHALLVSAAIAVAAAIVAVATIRHQVHEPALAADGG